MSRRSHELEKALPKCMPLSRIWSELIRSLHASHKSSWMMLLPALQVVQQGKEIILGKVQ